MISSDARLVHSRPPHGRSTSCTCFSSVRQRRQVSAPLRRARQIRLVDGDPAFQPGVFLRGRNTQDAAAVKRRIDDDWFSGRSFAQPLDAEFAELDILQRIGALPGRRLRAGSYGSAEFWWRRTASTPPGALCLTLPQDAHCPRPPRLPEFVA